MRILVTGASGRVGRNVVKHLSVDHELLNSDLLVDYTDSYARIDVTNREEIDEAMEEFKPELVIHMGAEVSRLNGEKHPERMVQVNALGTLNIARSCAKYGSRLINFCYDPETRAFTQKGLKYYNELEVGDLVLSLNTETRNIEWKPITKINVQTYQGNMVQFKGQGADLIVTPNHKMLIEAKIRGKVGFQLFYEAAEKTMNRSFFRLVSGGGWVGSQPSNPLSSPTAFYLMGLYLGDGYTPSYMKHLVKSGLNRVDYLKNARNKNGTFRRMEAHPEKREYHYPRTFLAIPETDRATPRVEAALNELGLKWSRDVRGTTIYFHPRQFETIFIKCGHGARNKRIPRILLDAPQEYLKMLLRGILDSDGNHKNVIATTSLSLVEGVIELCAKLGLSVHFGESESKPVFYRDHWINATGPTYWISIGRQVKGFRWYKSRIKSRPQIRTHPPRSVEYEGVVWCPEVRDNHNLLVERNGCSVFCGNSTSEVYGASFGSEVPVTEGISLDAFNQTNIYSISKTFAEAIVKHYVENYGLTAITVRPFMLYGEGDYPSKSRSAMTHFVYSCLTGQRFDVHKGTKRSWLHHDDFVDGLSLLLDKIPTGYGAYNIGSEEYYPMEETALMVVEETGADPSLINLTDPPLKFGTPVKVASTEKIKALGFSPKVSLKEGIKRVVKWQRANVL